MLRLRQFLASSGRINLARMSARELPVFSTVLAIWALGNALLPNAVLVTIGSVVTATINRPRAHLPPLGGRIHHRRIGGLCCTLGGHVLSDPDPMRADRLFADQIDLADAAPAHRRRLLSPLGSRISRTASTLDKICLAQGSPRMQNSWHAMAGAISPSGAGIL